MYSNPYLEKLEKSRADPNSPDASPSPDPMTQAHPSLPADVAESYLQPIDPTTCVSNNPRSLDSWCRDMCGAGVCTAEMCKCDGDAADADVDSENGALAIKRNVLDVKNGPDLARLESVPGTAPKPDAGGNHGMTEGVDPKVVQWIGDEELPEYNPQTEKTFMPNMYSNPYLEKLEKSRADPNSPDASPSPDPMTQAHPSLPADVAESYLQPIDPTTCVSNNPRSIDSWCRDMCGAGVCTAEMCKR